MTNKHYLTFMLLLLGAVLSSCGSDDDGMDIVKPVTPPASGTSWTVDVVAETTRGLSVSGNVLTQSWSTTDNIFVYYEDQKVGVLHPASAATSGVVRLLGNIDTPATPYRTSGTLSFYYQCDKGFSNYSDQDGTLVKIASDYDYAKAEAEITAVNTSERKLTVALASFQPQQAIVKFTFKRGDVDTATKPALSVTTFTVSAPGALANDITVTASPAASELYVALPVSSATKVKYYITATGTAKGYLNSTVEKTLTSSDLVGTLPETTLKNGKYYTSEVRLYEAVQLWEHGPMWAKNNLRTSSDRYNTTNGYYDPAGGNYFCWAGKDGRSHKDYFSNGSTDLKYIPYYNSTSGYTKYNTSDKKYQLELADDAAYVNWGKACRIPTNDEFNDLITKTTYTWSSSGAKFTGKGAYSTKSITLTPHGFLNSTDVNDTNQCHYWSSSMVPYGTPAKPHGGGLVAYSQSNCSVSSWVARNYGKPIRPIIDWK